MSPNRKEAFYQQMTNSFYKAKIPFADHTTFGGKIYHSDFDRKTTLSEMAEKITSDRKFDQQCRKNAEIKKEWEESKHV